ncbi:MAG: GNAT family N-acetyltransferase, partial [Erythrobacter sp.]|uniref:GNAT family N-acetyltransferase n=1 Tax=Erythrobacter sp. TaxID=1042 RepID=UPI00329821B8
MTPSNHHIARIMTVMAEAFDPTYGEAWNVRQVSDALAMPSTRGLVIDETGAIIADDSPDDSAKAAVGFVLTRQAADEEELLLIAVSPDFRQRGLGEGLIQTLFQHAKSRGTTRIFLEMRRGNPAIHLYEKVGFRPIGERPNYYRLTN